MPVLAAGLPNHSLLETTPAALDTARSQLADVRATMAMAQRPALMSLSVTNDPSSLTRA